MDEKEYLDALREANSLLRSAYQIASREGAKTNWELFRKALMKELMKEHKILYPLQEKQNE